MFKIVLTIALVVLIVAAGLYLGLSKKLKNIVPNNPVSQVIESNLPQSAPPLTPQNADQQLGQTDVTLQDDLTQVDKDLQALDQSNSNQDTVDKNAATNF